MESVTFSRMPAEVDPLDVVGVSFNASMGNALSREAGPLSATIEADDKTLLKHLAGC